VCGLPDGSGRQTPALPQPAIERKETSMTRVALLERLQELQQMPKFQNRDIRTISAVLSNEALARHIAVCEQAASAPGRAAAQDARPGAVRG
jgi:hypothetical protein